MDQSLWVVLAVSIGMLPAAIEACTHFTQLIGEMEHCSQNFTSYKTLVLTGQLTADNKPAACKRYDDIINCMEGIIADCQLDEAIQLEHAQAILRDHVQGFGKLCDEDQAFFNGYMAAAPCYSRQSRDTTGCMDTLADIMYDWQNDQIDDSYTYEEDYGNPSICKSINTMYGCVRSAVTSCGRDAVSMYTKLSQFHVPQELVTHCVETEIFWHDDTDASLGRPAGTKSFTLIVVLLALTYTCLTLASADYV